MEFASIIFIWCFLPAVLAAYYLIELNKNKRKRILLQNIILLFFSFIFYLWAGFKAFLLLSLMILMNYGAGIWMGNAAEGETKFFRKRKSTFIVTLLGNLLLLAFFKYFNMMITLTEIFLAPKTGLKDFAISLMLFEGTGEISTRHIVMPLAISFTVFQSISYLADVYTKKILPEKNIILFALYISFFPQMTQGPIMRFADLSGQIKNRETSFDLFSSGVKLFCYGMGKKVIIANTVAAAANNIWKLNITNICTFEAWLGVLFYTLQIYYDFSGYSDMAIGIGKMFGFTLSENFKYPYTALSVQEFWRRWHITLSSWFRDYIYIPLGGNRKGKGRTLFNIFIVFLATGIWHGANLTFICWGILFAFLMIMERLFLGSWLKKNPVKMVNWMYTMFFISMGWVLFRSPNLYYAWRYLVLLFSYVPDAEGLTIASYFNAETLTAVIAGILFCGVFQRLMQGTYEKIKDSATVQIFGIVIPLLIFMWSLCLVFSGSYSPSIYGAF